MQGKKREQHLQCSTHKNNTWRYYSHELIRRRANLINTLSGYQKKSQRSSFFKLWFPVATRAKTLRSSFYQRLFNQALGRNTKKESKQLASTLPAPIMKKPCGALITGFNNVWPTKEHLCRLPIGTPSDIHLFPLRHCIDNIPKTWRNSSCCLCSIRQAEGTSETLTANDSQST